MSGPTPGPWMVSDEPWLEKQYPNTTAVVAPTNTQGPAFHIVAALRRNWPDTEANARLIAAAPEMLKSLRLAGEALIDLLEGETCDHSVGICYCFEKAVLLDIGDIVARVKGEDNG